jgi:hypothetical protein
MPEHRDVKKNVKRDSAAVRSVLNRWDPVAGSPGDEYDCLVDHIVSALHSGKSRLSDVATLIATEMKNHFNLVGDDDEIADAAARILRYWEHRHE